MLRDFSATEKRLPIDATSRRHHDGVAEVTPQHEHRAQSLGRRRGPHHRRPHRRDAHRECRGRPSLPGGVIRWRHPGIRHFDVSVTDAERLGVVGTCGATFPCAANRKCEFGWWRSGGERCGRRHCTRRRLALCCAHWGGKHRYSRTGAAARRRPTSQHCAATAATTGRSSSGSRK